jgi:carbonic anhydrase
MSKNSPNISRRNLLNYGALTVASGALTACLNKGTVTQGTNTSETVAQNRLAPDASPEEALEALMAGNKRFVENKRQSPNLSSARLTEVAEGQSPFASILSCADSRVPVEILFDRGLGDLFVVRDAGNIATPEEIGSLEFGTLVLGAKVLMVLGHEGCGAVAATLAGKPVPGQIGSIIEAIKPAVERSKGQPGDELENATKANVLLQMERLKESPVIAELITEGKLMVVGGYYDLDTGAVSLVS